MTIVRSDHTRAVGSLRRHHAVVRTVRGLGFLHRLSFRRNSGEDGALGEMRSRHAPMLRGSLTCTQRPAKFRTQGLHKVFGSRRFRVARTAGEVAPNSAEHGSNSRHAAGAKTETKTRETGSRRRLLARRRAPQVKSRLQALEANTDALWVDVEREVQSARKKLQRIAAGFSETDDELFHKVRHICGSDAFLNTFPGAQTRARALSKGLRTRARSGMRRS